MLIWLFEGACAFLDPVSGWLQKPIEGEVRIGAFSNQKMQETGFTQNNMQFLYEEGIDKKRNNAAENNHD